MAMYNILHLFFYKANDCIFLYTHNNVHYQKAIKKTIK